MTNFETERRSVAGEFANALVYTGLEDPLKSGSQFVDHFADSHWSKALEDGFKHAGVSKPVQQEFLSANWFAQQAGSGIGMLAPLLLTHRYVVRPTGTVMDKIVGANSEMRRALTYAAPREMLTSASTGLFYGGVLRSSDDNNVHASAFWWDRTKNGAADMALFGTIGGTTPLISRGLGLASASIQRTVGLDLMMKSEAGLTNRLATAVTAAAPAGLVGAEVNAWKQGRSGATFDEILESTAAMAFVTTPLSGAHWMGAQREGTLTTNARHLSDKVGLTTPPGAEVPVQFRVVGGKESFDQFVKNVDAGSATSDVTVSAQPRLHTLGSGVFGDALAKFGQTRDILLSHRGMGGTVNAADAAVADMVATCAPLEGSAAAKSVFRDHEGQVWLQRSAGDTGAFSLHKQKPADSVDNQTDVVPLGKGKRVTGPQPTKLQMEIDVLGQPMKPPGSAKLEFTVSGERASSSFVAATTVRVGVSETGWPYFEAGAGFENWTINGKPLERGRNYLDIKGGDRLQYNNVLALTAEVSGSGKNQTLDIRTERPGHHQGYGIRDREAVLRVNGREVQTAQTLTFGNGPNCDIYLPFQANAVGVHGLIGRRPDGLLFVRDTAGTGVFVNGQRASQNKDTVLTSTDHVVLGPRGMTPIKIENLGLPAPPPPVARQNPPVAPPGNAAIAQPAPQGNAAIAQPAPQGNAAIAQPAPQGNAAIPAPPRVLQVTTAVGTVEIPLDAVNPKPAKPPRLGRKHDSVWSGSMDDVLYQAAMEKLPDGTMVPRFNDVIEARKAASYFATLIHRHSSLDVNYAHGDVSTGTVPMLEVSGVEGVLAFQLDGPSIVIGVTPIVGRHRFVELARLGP